MTDNQKLQHALLEVYDPQLEREPEIEHTRTGAWFTVIGSLLGWAFIGCMGMAAVRSCTP